MDWDKLRIFHAVADAGSFTHAGESLNLSQSAVSRQVSALEDSLNAPLFHRHARGLILTEQGEELHRTVGDVFGKLTAAEARIREIKERPQGRLRVTSTVAFGSVWLVPRVHKFLERYPDIDLSVVLADTELDLSMRQAEVAIRMMPPTQHDLIQRRLITMRHHVFAAPDYLKRYGMPKTATDLDEHRIVVYGEDAKPPVRSLNWLLEAGHAPGERRRPALQVNSAYAIFRAVQSGIGLGGLPDFMSSEASNLVEVLPELRGPSYELYFVYPEELRLSKRVAVFRDFLLDQIEKGR